MSEFGRVRREREEDTPQRQEADAAAPGHEAPAPTPQGVAGRGARGTPNLRLRYRPAGGTPHTLPDERVAAVTRQALEGLGGAGERAEHLMPGAEC